uniref:Uncharacterized protein n=1 Tax=Arundo donax TaxID=35708 RepID=A0A0A9C7K7_ARUDO
MKYLHPSLEAVTCGERRLPHGSRQRLACSHNHTSHELDPRSCL